MILHVQITPYSSTVGGGLILTDAEGRARFIIMLAGTDRGLTKQESDEITHQIAALIGDRGLTVTDRPKLEIISSTETIP